MEENANKLHLKCTNFNFSTRVTAYAECIYVFLLKSFNLVLVAEYHVDRCQKHCSDVCCDQFPMPQIYRKSQQVKER